MSLQAFSFPLPETRYFRAGGLIYQFKIRGGSSFRDEKFTGEDSKNQELEEMIRTVLGNLERLRPFSSAHYTAFPYRKRRARRCKHAGKRLRFYPFTLLLYLEKNLHCGQCCDQRSIKAQVEKRTTRGRHSKGFLQRQVSLDQGAITRGSCATCASLIPSFWLFCFQQFNKIMFLIKKGIVIYV
uniref:Uncharacterized protein n=1 Tax=Oryzias sinensis TaxID=183150 RepID=A0A8C7WMX9_9TELE